jgi:hypothetical protein
MRIIINNIDANIVNTSTAEKDDFMINFWKIRYTVHFDSDHFIEGNINWFDPPFMQEILNTLRKLYDNPTFTE